MRYRPESPLGRAQIAARVAEAREVNDELRALFLPQHSRRPTGGMQAFDIAKARNPPRLLSLMFYWGEERSHHQWRTGFALSRKGNQHVHRPGEIQNERQGTRGQVQRKN